MNHIHNNWYDLTDKCTSAKCIYCGIREQKDTWAIEHTTLGWVCWYCTKALVSNDTKLDILNKVPEGTPWTCFS